MTDKAHSQVNEGSRHAIHNLTYPNAANRIAGTGEGKGINPPTSANLWQIAKQDDDDSLWMMVDESPLTWKQIPVGVAGTPNLDDVYDNFGANPSTVVVDAAQGQGTALKFDMNSAVADRFFEVALDNGQDPTGDPLVYHTGFTVTNGTDFWTAGRAGANQINLVGEIENVLLEVANIFQIETDSVELKLLSDVATGNFVDLFGDGKLTGSSGTQRYLDIAPAINQSGTAGYDGLRVNPAITAVGSGEQNLLNLQLGGANRFRVASDGNTRIGTGTPGVATGAGAAYVTDKLEVDGAIHADLGVIIPESVTLTLGVAGNSKIQYAGNQTAKAAMWGLPATSDTLILCQQADTGFNFAHALQTNPTLFIHSANQSTTEWGSFAHDQTHFRIKTGTGATCIGTGTPGTANAIGDLFVTDAIELGGNLYVKDNKALLFGTSGDVQLRYATANTPDTFAIGVSTESNSCIIAQVADLDYDFSHALQTNPTLFIHSASQSTTEWLSLAHDQTYARLLTGAGAVCVGTGTPGYATAAGSLYVTGKGEFDDSVQLGDGKSYFVGGQDSTIGHVNATTEGAFLFRRSSQSPDSNLIATGSRSNAYIMCEYADAGYDFAHALQTNPTLFGHSANQSTTEWWSLTHNQTDGVLATGAGALSLAPASGVLKYPDAGQVLFDIAPASDHTATGDTVSATVDTNATGFAAALYQAADGNWDEADADAIATMPCRALALETGTGTKLILRRGWIRDDSWSWTPGAPVYASTTAGGLTQTKPSGTGDQVQIVGYAETATVLDFNPSTVIVEVA
jgi:hypothetical protein